MLKKINSGFSLVELLAVIVIIGILSTVSIVAYNRYISKSRDEAYIQNRNNLVVAAKSYIQANKKQAPKAVGDSVTIKLSTLQSNNYFFGDVLSENGDVCNDAYVTVYKYDSNNYSYLPHICSDGGSGEETISPVIQDINFSENNEFNNAYVKFEIWGNNASSEDEVSAKIISYNYNIYADSGTGEYRNIFSSGAISVKNKKVLSSKTVNLTPYINITEQNKIKISITAVNEYGLKTNKESVLNINDNEGPRCGEIIGQAGDKWLTKEDYDEGKRRTITVKCEDNGSGCQKSEYKSTWPKKDKKSVDMGSIFIMDNFYKKGDTGDSANEHRTECEVSVKVDIVPPIINVKAYKRDADDNKQGSVIASTTSTDGQTKTINVGDYANANGSDSWLNNANYPHGVVYQINVNDDLELKSLKWEYNNLSLPIGSSPADVKEIRGHDDVDLTGVNSDSLYVSLSGQGMRYGKITVEDKAGNVSVVNVYANIDRAAPTAPTVHGRTKPTSGDYYGRWEEIKNNHYTFGTWHNGYVYTAANGSTDELSGLDGYYATSIGQSSDITNSKQDHRSIDIEGDVIIKYHSCDKAGNCNSDVVNHVMLDRTPPTTPTVHGRTKPTSGDYYGRWEEIKNNHYTFGTWHNGYVYTAANGSTDELSGLDGYYATSIGQSSDITNSKQDHRSIDIQGDVIIKYHSCDKVGNCNSDVVNHVKLDRTSPTCSVSKTNTGIYGVSGYVSCSDSLSGCSGYSYGGLTYSKSYGVTDNAGNSGSCYVSVSSYDCNCSTCGGECNNWISEYSCDCHWTCYQANGGIAFITQSYSPGSCVAFAGPFVQTCDTCGGYCASYAPTYSCNCSTCYQ